MTVTIELSAEVQARLQGEASRRGITLDQLVAELAAQLPSDASLGVARRLSFVGMGTSQTGRSARDADEMLAEGFGRD